MAPVATTHLHGSVPISRTRLIGRERERGTIRSLLLVEGAPLLTLTGPGGVGKTRLAEMIASDLAGQFADGVAWVDLSVLADPAIVPAAVAAGLTGANAADDASADAIVAQLRSRQLLLLLDNCEHVAAAVAALVSAILAGCAAVQIVATSRATLRLREERCFAVEPLPSPVAAASFAAVARSDAARLFIERTRAVDPEFAVTEQNAAVIGELCRQLDGLPLAIELAAARGAVLSPEALLAQMSDRLRLLGQGMRNAPARQQTMTATIAWSYALLDPSAQALLRGLAVFVDGFTLEAAERVMGDGSWVLGSRQGGETARRQETSRESFVVGQEPTANSQQPAARDPSPIPHHPSPSSALDLVASLVEQSLLRRDDAGAEPRYVMLETIRAFALERLDEAGEREGAEESHAAYFIDCAVHSLWRSGVADRRRFSRQRKVRERANLRAAIAHAMAVGDGEGALWLAAAFAWHAQVRPQEGRAWLEWALAHTPEAATIPRGHALGELAYVSWSQGRYDEAIPLAEAGRAIGEELAEPEIVAGALHVRGLIALSQQRYAQARPLLTEALALWRALDEPLEEAEVLELLAAVEQALGNDGAATRHAAAALARFRDIGYGVGVAIGLNRVARLAVAAGDDAAAARAYAEAVQLCLDAGNRLILAGAFAGLSEVACRHGQAEVAAALLGAIDATAREFGAERLGTAGVIYDRAVAAARVALGGDRFAECAVAGQRLRMEEVAALARGVAVPTGAGVEPRGGVGNDLRREMSLAPAMRLTWREQEVLALLCQRLTDAEIAERLFLSPRTASRHVGRILAKLGAANRREAAAIAARHYLV